MQLIALVGAVALGIGSVDAIPQPAAPNAQVAREVPAKYLYRAKYHSRLRSMPPFFAEPSVSIATLSTAVPTTTAPSLNHAFPPGPYYRRPHVDAHTIDTIATATATTRPWFFRPGSPSNGTRPTDRWAAGIRAGARGRNATNNLAGHGPGPHGGPDRGHWMTSSCTSSIVSVTLTQTVNVTVTATAAWSHTGIPMSYHTINGTLVPCPTTSTASGTGGGASASHDHAWPWVWPRPPAPTTAQTQTVTLTLSHATTRSRTYHTVTVTDKYGNAVPVETACVIDPMLRPVVTGRGGPTTTTTTFVPATATVCAKGVQSGAPPSKGSVYCGVRGRAEESGHFLGRFEENVVGEEITLEGCWMFCERSTFGASQGCRSYGFYRDDVGKPRCDLYGGPVAYALDVLDGRQNSTWFDKECGNPMDDEKWHTGGTGPHPGSGVAVGAWVGK